jgi:hypothetical protein
MRKDGEVLERDVFDLGARRKPQVFYRGCGESMEIQSELACNLIISTKQRILTEYGTTERPRRLQLRSYRQP